MYGRRRFYRKRRYTRRPYRSRKYKSGSYKRRRTFRASKWSPKKITYRKVKFQLTTLNYSNSATAPTTWSYTPRMADATEYASYAALFDQYRIRGVKLQFIPVLNLADGTSLPSTGRPSNLHYFTDPDSEYVFPVASISQFIAHYGCKTRTSYASPWSVYWKPKLAKPVYATGTTWGYGQGSEKTWIDSEDTNVPYYGFYLMWEATQLPFYINVYATFYIEYRGTK